MPTKVGCIKTNKNKCQSSKLVETNMKLFNNENANKIGTAIVIDNTVN